MVFIRKHIPDILIISTIISLFLAALFSWRTPEAAVAAPATATNETVPHNQQLFSSELSVDLRTDNGIRSRLTTINFDALGGDAGPLQDSAARGEQIELNLFNDTAITAVLDRLEHNPSGSYSWIGHEAGTEGRIIVLVVKDGMIYGQINSTQGAYRISFAGSNQHEIEQINPNQIERIGPDSIIPVSNEGETAVAPTALGFFGIDDGSIIDVLPLFTDTLVAATTGGKTTLLMRVEAAIAYTNQAYASSEVSQRVALVGPDAGLNYAYTEPGAASSRACSLTGGMVTGILDVALCDVTLADVAAFTNVPADRNTYHADLVALFMNTGGGGLAWVQDTVNGNAENIGYSAMEGSFSEFGSLFAHELGHNMGLAHEWHISNATGGNGAAFDYAHGYVDTTNNFNTIMAYGTECGGCSNIDYFASPGVNYLGNPTGVSSAASTVGCGVGNPSAGCPADAGQSLDGTAVNTSQFRISQITWTGATDGDWNTASNWEIVEGNANAGSPSTTTVNRVPRMFDDVVIPTGLGTYPTISSGTVNARMVIIQTGASLDMSNGTLNVYGDWIEQGTGQFNGTGGTVMIGGTLDQEITANASSTFNNLTIGNGSTNQITTLSNITVNGDLSLTAGVTLDSSSNSADVNGNITIAANASYNAQGSTINVAGNWSEGAADSFVPGTSTVIFDGTTQTVDKVTTSNPLNEDFSAYDGGCGCTSGLPTGWTTANGDFFQGELDSTSGASYRWRNETDGYLFTSALDLIAGVEYTLNYDTRARRNFTDGDLVTSDQTVEVFIGTSQTVGAMSTTIDGPFIESNTAFQNQSTTFTVLASGTYYIAFRATQSGDDYTGFDNISVTGTADITFYNLQVSSTTAATFNENVGINNNLTVNSSGIMDLSTNDASVEGTVTNNGTLRQTKPTSAATEFLHIQNAAASVDKYYGLTITPALDMGNVVVNVKGNQAACTTVPLDAMLHRCYDISPTTPQSATLRLYFTDAERNNQAANTLRLWHNNGGGSWSETGSGNYTRSETGITCSSTTYCWFERAGVNSYSAFNGGSGVAPTAVSLNPLTITPNNLIPWLLLTLTLLLTTTALIYHRRHTA